MDQGHKALTSLISLLILRWLFRVRLSSVFKEWYAEDPFILFKSFLYFSCRLKMERGGKEGVQTQQYLVYRMPDLSGWIPVTWENIHNQSFRQSVCLNMSFDASKVTTLDSWWESWEKLCIFYSVMIDQGDKIFISVILVLSIYYYSFIYILY